MATSIPSLELNKKEEVRKEQSTSEQAGILLLGRILATLSEALVPIIIVRLLGKVDVGYLSGLLLIYTTISQILTTGLPETLMFFLPNRSIAERRAISWKVGSALFGLGLLTALVLLLIPIFHYLSPTLFNHIGNSKFLSFNSTIISYLALFALYPLADLPARMFTNFLVVEGCAVSAAVVAIVKSVGNSLAVILPLSLGFNLMAVIFCLVIFGYAYGSLLIYFLFKIYHHAPSISSPISFKQLFRFAIPLGLTDIVSMLNNAVDRYLILLTFSAATFAEYCAGAWQIPILTTIAYTVGTAYSPKFVTLFQARKPKEAISIWQQSIAKVSLIVIPLTSIFIIAAEETIELLFTVHYLHGANVFRLYSALTLGRVASFGNVILAAGKPRYVLQAAIFSCLSNLIISIPLLKLLGFIGPALGTLLAFIPMVIFYCWCIARATGLKATSIFPLKNYLKRLFTAGIACIPAILYKVFVSAPASTKLPTIAVLVIVTFSLIGSLTGQIKRSDWNYVGRWLRLKMLFQSRRNMTNIIDS